MMLGKNIQGSDSKISHANVCRLFNKIALAFILAQLALQAVAEEGGRIGNGQIPPPGKYPAIGRLVSSKNLKNLACVLSILNRDWLMAPASCLISYLGRARVEGLSVVVGDEILNETEPYEQVVKVERFILHHRFDGAKGSTNEEDGDDIAVIKVTPPIKFSNRVTASNLPTCNDFEPGNGTIVGYGNKERRLTEITNKIISHEECSKKLPGVTFDDRVFCVQAIDKMAACIDDWGAPFYLVKSDAHMVLHGLMSRYTNGLSCGADGQVAVFTRVSSYVGWIHRRISGCGNHPWHNKTELIEPSSN